MKKQTQKKIASWSNRYSVSALHVGLVVTVVAFNWVILSFAPHADTSTTASFQAEAGTKVGNITQITDASAAGGSAVKFGGGGSTPSPIKVMPLGDSITAGLAFDQQLAYNGSYRVKLWKLLADSGIAIDYVGTESNGPTDLPDHNHQGVGGIWIKDNRGDPGFSVYDYISGWLNTSSPDLILMHLGTNDLYSGSSEEETAQRLDALLGRIYASKPNVHIIVAQIIPLQPPQNWYPNYNTLARAKINAYAAQGYHISTVDMSSILTANDYADILHPVKSGYDKMADVWLPGVKAMVANW